MEKLERLHTAYNYLRDNGMAHTQTDVANKMGATKQNVSSAMRGMPKVLTDNFLQRFASAYGFNAQWLIYGSGDMVSQPKNGVVQLNHVQKGSPVYDIDATCGADVRDMRFADEHIIGYVDLPDIKSGTQIIRANGDSMLPVIHDGNMVAIREVTNWNTVFYGQIYLVLLDEYRMLKYIRRYEDDELNYVILRSANADYDDMIVRKDSIRKLFIVENILSVKIQM